MMPIRTSTLAIRLMRLMRLMRLIRLAACALLLAATGCALIGPAAISNGRPLYSEAISVTDDQQLLSLIVRTRYDEGTALLLVSSVTANVSVRASAGAQFGFGPDDNFSGNLVPLSTGIAYEENPTISYVPVDGQRYIEQLLSPLPIDLTVLLLDASHDVSHMMTLVLESANGIRNPDFMTEPSDEVDDRFARMAELIGRLDRAGVMAWVQRGEAASFAIHLSGHESRLGEEVRELYELLGLDAPAQDEGELLLPVKLGLGKPATAGIRLNTRSVYDLIRIAAAAVEVPEEDVASGRAWHTATLGPAGAGIRIRRSEKRPADAMVAVRHHDSWYYIDATDGASKRAFRIISSLVSVRIADTVDRSKGTPVLTLPASG